MLYVIVEGEDVKKVMLVKADSKEEVEGRIKLKESEGLFGSFTSAETSALDSSPFIVIS